MTNIQPLPVFISHQSAVKRFSLKNYFPLDLVEASVVIVMDGNTHLDTDIDDWYESILKENPDYDGTLMVIINGDLKVQGVVTGKKDFNAHLLILGNLYCDFLFSNDEVTWVTGNAKVKYVFDGNYNDGSIDIKGTIDVPFLLNSNHSSQIKPSESSIIIGYYGDDGFLNYDLIDDDFEDGLIPETMANGELDRTAFYKIVKSGRSPLKEGFEIKRLLK